MAMNVPNSSTPLPHDSRFSGNNSGNKPYFDGPKNALCVPMKKTAASCIGRLLTARPTDANSITNTSKILTPMVTVRLLKRSARNPPAIENRMNGSANNALTCSPTRCRAGLGKPGRQDEENDEVLQRIVAERALKLGDDQTPKAPQ